MNPAHPSNAIAAPHPVPDRHGSNPYTTDAQFAPLLKLYLPQTSMRICSPISRGSACWPAGALTNWRW